MDTIVKIISQFDIVAIQEIRDKFGTDYNYVIGPRLGRTSSSKEQYAYMYRADTVEPLT